MSGNMFISTSHAWIFQNAGVFLDQTLNNVAPKQMLPTSLLRIFQMLQEFMVLGTI